MNCFKDLLSDGDLRSVGKVDQVISQVNDQHNFDTLFRELFNSDRKVAMRAADAIEKITVYHPYYLNQHKNKILTIFINARDIEKKWHLALLVSRLELTKREMGIVWKTLTGWATNKKESRIVRVNSLQGLYNILRKNTKMIIDFDHTLQIVTQENIPSINARVRKLKNLVDLIIKVN